MYALEGIRVLDLCRSAAGAYCSMLLGDLGADVLMIEEVDRLAADGGLEPATLDVVRGAALDPLRRNKRSLAVDLGHGEGRAIFYELVARADVVLAGFRPGEAQRLGVDYDTVQTLNERVIYASLTAFGQSGPYSEIEGGELGPAALGGALAGAAPAPLSLASLVSLAGGGMMAAFAVSTALFHRQRNGQGQHIDHAASDGVLSLMAPAAAEFFASGSVPPPGAARLGGALPSHGVYACRDGRRIAVSALEGDVYRRLCRGLGLPGLEEHGLDGSWEAREEVRAAFEARFLERTRDEWFAILREADTGAAPVYELDEALNDPHHRHRSMMLTIDHDLLGAVPQLGVAPQLLGTPGAVRSAGPYRGQHSDDVLREAGYGGPEIAELRRAGIVS
jgi:crotonobetainyl-CoA:carnitine CoA-transferase CaiB-like acyl-CoA transferase